MCPTTGRPVYLKVGRFGPYVQRGSTEDEEKPQNASLMKGMTPEDVDFATALRLLSLPRDLGEHPTLGGLVQAFNGRYGPYVKCGGETRSLPGDVSPLDVTLDQAIELLNQPKQRGRGAAKPPIKVFEEKSPVTGGVVQIMDGRYGPYVSDGESNASLPKAQSPEELTFAAALELLAARAAAGGSKKKPAKKTAKKAATKKATTKKATSKKAAKGAKKRATKKAE